MFNLSRYFSTVSFILIVLAAGVLGLHECDNPVCVKVAAATDVQQHVVSGSQGDNMERMARIDRRPHAMRLARPRPLRLAPGPGALAAAGPPRQLLLNSV